MKTAIQNIYKSINKKKGGASIIVWVFLALIFYNGNWHLRNYAPEKLKKENIRYWSDAEGYYLYLPAIVNGSFENLPVKTTGKWIKPEGYTFTKYTYGVALLEAPFFIVTHLIVKISAPELADGFTWPYQVMANIIAFFYGFLGMFYLFKLLRKKHSIFVCALTVIGLMYGTNYFYYILRDPGATHIYAFFCVALLFWFISSYYEHKKIKDLIVVSFLIALTALMRPTNLIFVLFFLLWDVNNWKDLSDRFFYWIKNIKFLFISPLIFFAMYALQVYFWYMMSGETMIYSYEAGFDWSNPKIVHVLLHFENGFIMYAPIMVLSIIGLFMGMLKEKNSLLILIVFALMTYVFSCWVKWSFGGAFGYRPFLDFLPMFAIPLAYLFSCIFKNWKLPFQVLTVLFVGYLCKITLTFMKKMPGHLYERPHYNWDSFLDLMERVWF